MAEHLGERDIKRGMQIDATENRIMWYGAVIALIGQSAALVIIGNWYIAVVLFAIGMILLNLSVFLENKPKTVISALLILLEAAAVVAGARWYIGALALPVITLSWFSDRKLLRGLGIVLCFGALSCHLILLKPDFITGLLFAAFSLLSFLLWEGILLVLSRTKSTNERLNLALTAAAVDALEQRSLREEIAKNQKINENNARLEERERISRDIHNYVGHTLSAATVTLDAATILVPNDQEKALEKIDVANSRVHEAISSVRSVVRTLDAEDDRIAVDDYLLSLDKRIEEFKMDTAYKVYHNFSQIQSKERIPIQTASFLTSSLSELLTNGVRHGQADLFVVSFALDGSHIRLKVQDNGTGWGKISLNEKKMRLNRGFGLRKMKDYVENHGGTFEIESEDGFVVSLSLPFVTEGESK